MNQSYRKALVVFFAGAIVVGLFMANPATAVSNPGSGGMEGIVSTDIFKVVLPTVPETSVSQGTPVSTIYDFLLDPNLMVKDKYPDKNVQPNATLLFKNASGTPYDYSNTSDSLTIQNKSTMDVDVKLNVELTDMDNLLTNDSAFANDKNTSVYLAVTDSNNKTSVVDKFGAFLRKTLSGSPNAYEYSVDPSTGRYKYALKSDSKLQADNITFENYNFKLTGSCNSSADWSEFIEPASAKLTVIWKVSPRPADLAPSIGKTSYIMSKNIPNMVDVDLGSGKLAATNISSITYKNSSGITVNLGTGNYSFSGDTLTFNAAYITSIINGGISSRSHTITFNDKTATRKIVTLAVHDIAPSIEKTLYSMTKDQSVQATINLGSGEARATGIKSITFINPSGIRSPLGTKFYSFNNGTLEFYSSGINLLLEKGILSRTFTITLNDKAATQWDITLAADGTSPSIATTSYSILRDQPVSVDVDLGSKDLAATAVNSVAFVNPSGTSVTVDAKFYSFSNGIFEFNDLAINALINGGVISRTFIITFNDALNTRIAVTLKTVDVAPSIAGDSFKMTRGQPVSVDVDMGAGNLRAAGINSITFTNPSGVHTTLAAKHYTLNNRTLQFASTAIDLLFKNGITSCTFTVTLNDKNSTEWPVTLYTDSRLPSIAIPTYSIRKGESVSVKTDMGSGDFEASAIKSITFINPLGAVATLNTNFYVYNNGTKTLKFTPEATNLLVNSGILSRIFTITFDNIANTRAVITLNVADTPPSITSGTYKMISGQPVIVKINLGAGNLGATGIKSITFTNPSGAVATLAPKFYVLSKSDDTLSFTKEGVDTLLKSGIASRAFTVTLNDKAETHGVITLSR